MLCGAGCPLTGSTGATVSIFLGRNSEARELRAELGGHSLWQAAVTTYYVKDCVSSGLRHFQSRRTRVGACGKTTSASYMYLNQLLYRDPMPLI